MEAQAWHEAPTSAGVIRYRDVGTGDPVVFVHGVLSSSTLWGPILPPCDAYDNFPPAKISRLLNLAGRTPGGLRLTGHVMRVRPLQRLPVTLGHLIKHRPDPAVVDGWFEPIRAQAGVRRDLAKLLRALDSRYTVEAAERLRSFAAPVLLAWATEDRVFPFEHARRLAADMPDARLESIGDSYSFVPLDQPSRTSEVIAAFLAS